VVPCGEKSLRVDPRRPAPLYSAHTAVELWGYPFAQSPIRALEPQLVAVVIAIVFCRVVNVKSGKSCSLQLGLDILVRQALELECGSDTFVRQRFELELSRSHGPTHSIRSAALTSSAVSP